MKFAEAQLEPATIKLLGFEGYAQAALISRELRIYEAEQLTEEAQA